MAKAPAKKKTATRKAAPKKAAVKKTTTQKVTAKQKVASKRPVIKVAEKKKPTKAPARIPLRITDTTLRDAHQSLWATRMRTSDILEIIDVIDNAGYYSLEMWGGATFDVCMRFLRENPWERLRLVKSRAKKTPLQMLLRGQNVLGYQNYPDDLLDRFVALACENGMDIFRIFDALNDVRNLEYAIKAVNRYGGHAQGTICYTISPVHTVDEFVRIAQDQVALGIDSLCIKDMAGILSPIAAEKLVSALVAKVDVPIQIHSHMTSGMAVATYVESVRAGAGAIDCAISPMAGSSSQPPVETLLSIFEETEHHADLDVDALRKICKFFLELAPSRQLSHQPKNSIDPEILLHHIPGGMISNLRSQLEQQDALDRLNEVMNELPKARADMGYPPLVTPTSQIVGVQAVLNVLSGERYSMVTQETKNYVRGLYGRAPAEVKPSLKKKILGKNKPVTCRPADLLEPMLPNATKDVDPELFHGEEDIISFCLFPEPALEYFRWRNLPIGARPETPADLERKEIEQKAEPVQPAAPFLSDHDYSEIQNLIEKVNELDLSEVTIRRDDLTLSLKGTGLSAERGEDDETAPAPKARAAKPKAKQSAPQAAETAAPSGPTIDAPLNGTFYRSAGPGKPNYAEEGATVGKGDAVCIVEAMKLFNQIKAPGKCKVVKFLANHGDAVTKGQPLVEIEKL